MTDGFSGILRLLTGALGGGHPMRLLLAVSCSLVIKMALSVLARTYPGMEPWLTLNEFPLYWYIIIVAPIFYLFIIVGRRGALESTIHQVNTIKLLIDQGGFTAAQRQMMWRTLIEKYLEAAQPDLTQQPKVASLFEEVTAEHDKTTETVRDR